MEKELIVKLQGEIARLNSSYDVLKKRLEENSKQRVDCMHSYTCVQLLISLSKITCVC